jgi:hypothetical protein
VVPSQRLLKRQLSRCFGMDFRIPAEWTDFIACVAGAYADFENDRELIERSMELSSQELLEANSNLLQSREMFRLMAESTKAIPFTLDLTRGCFSYIGAQGISDSGIPESQWKEPGALDVILPRDSNPSVRQHFDACQDGPFEFVTALSLRNDRRTEVRWTGTCEVREDISAVEPLSRPLVAHAPSSIRDAYLMPGGVLRQGHWGQVVLASQEDRAHARTLSSVPKKAADRAYSA